MPSSLISVSPSSVLKRRLRAPVFLLYSAWEEKILYLLPLYFSMILVSSVKRPFLPERLPEEVSMYSSDQPSPLERAERVTLST